MQANPRTATGIHVNCISCSKRMYLSLVSAKKTIAHEDMIELNSILNGIDITDTDTKMEIETEDLMEISSDVVVANEEGVGGIGGGEGAGGRSIRMIHSDRTKLRTGCYAQTSVPLEEFKRLVRVVEEAQARAGV